MKNTLKLLVILCVLFISGNTVAQNGEKFGHINFAELYNMMPGLDTVRSQYQEYATTIQEQFDAMQLELENKYRDYEAKLSTMSPIIRQTKEKEMEDLQTRMEAFQASAQQDLQNKEAELTTPIIEKAEAAIKEVADEHGYTYILNTTGGLVLFADPGDNIMELVKEKLGIE